MLNMQHLVLVLAVNIYLLFIDHYFTEDGFFLVIDKNIWFVKIKMPIEEKPEYLRCW